MKALHLAYQLQNKTSQGGNNNSFIQSKLTINNPNDQYEQEADAVADKIMRMENPSIQTRAVNNTFFKPAPITLNEIQRKEINAQETTADNSLENYVGNLNGSGQSLSNEVRNFYEPRIGYDFSNVKVHTDAPAVKSAQSINALAYTSGNNIVFNSGQYAPGTNSGKRLLGHELTHVVQQGKSVIQRKAAEEKDCKYEKNEVDISHSSTGHLVNDVTELGNGKLLISDFGVDWRHVNSNVKTNAVLKKWDDTFAKDDSYKIKIVGYSDCAGSEKNNISLRQGRAKNVEDILGKDAQKRIAFRGMAGLGEYIVPNDSQINRAINRGVIIEFSQNIDFEPDLIEAHVDYCGPDSTSWLLDEMKTNANDPFIKKCGSMGYEAYIPGWGYGAMAACLKGFADLVRNGAIWDFKSNQKQWRYSDPKVCPSKKCDKTVTLCDRCLNYDVVGNIHYGYVGRFAGFSPFALHVGGDLAQKGHVDDPKDVVAIDIGISMADNGTDLCTEIKKHSTGLNSDGTKDCNPCQWGNWDKRNRKTK